jgi:hypothetical protein
VEKNVSLCDSPRGGPHSEWFAMLSYEAVSCTENIRIFLVFVCLAGNCCKSLCLVDVFHAMDFVMSRIETVIIEMLLTNTIASI